MCTPSRGQILTGVDCLRNGAMATSLGRHFLRTEFPTMADLFGTIEAFARRLFDDESVRTRFRSDFFPYTEPSAELAVSCVFCGGAGCRVCSHTGWIELGGCGMVDPNVFVSVGIDPEEWQGFAFGFGLERIAMIRYGIDEIRTFFDGDVRFLAQY